MRKILFWMHLTAGSLGGLVILVMSVTGVLLTYEKQMTAWPDRHFRSHPPSANSQRLSADDLIAHAGQPVSQLVFHSDPAAPVEASLGRDKTIYLDVYTGAVLGEASRNMRGFFSSVKSWHRWLAAEGPGRAVGRGVTGACNLAFLFLVVSGLVLWFPKKKKWNLQRFKQGMILRWNLTGKPRDWNWHNSIGFWCAIPLFVIVLSGVVMSYPWANNLVYSLTGNPVPEQGGGGRGGPERQRDNAAAQPAKDIEKLLLAAERQAPGWRTLTMRIPSARAQAVAFSIDEGNGGRPDKRSQITVSAKTGQVIKWERFDSYNSGRQLRSWLRFAHTGEAGGLLGQTIAGVASLGAVFLVWTGIALALRRLAKFRSRRAAKPLDRQAVQV